MDEWEKDQIAKIKTMSINRYLERLLVVVTNNRDTSTSRGY